MNDIDNVIKDLKIFGFNIFKTSKLDGGINSTAFKIETDAEKYVLKIYNTNKTNNINRFNNEEKFLKFLNQCNFTNVPRIIKTNPRKSWILISWIEGEKIINVDRYFCKELLDFLVRLQNFRQSPFSKGLPMASDTYLNLNGYFFSLKDRLFKILNRQKELEIVNKELSIKLKNLIDKIKSEISNLLEFSMVNKIDLNYVLPQKNRIISQSDVGFHNMIYGNNEVNFIDFEYSGWDDPGKLVGDLLLQPDHKIPIKYIDVLEIFMNTYIYKIDYPNERLLLILKLTRLKWALIILNPIINQQGLSNQDLSNLLENKIKKSINYLEKSLSNLNDINKNFITKSFNKFKT